MTMWYTATIRAISRAVNFDTTAAEPSSYRIGL